MNAVVHDAAETRRDEPPPAPAGRAALTTAELAECSCPDFCERDHDND